MVWVGVSGATAASAATVPGAWRQSGGSVGVDAVPDLVVAMCATALAIGLGHLWVVTSVTVLDLLRAPVRRPVTSGGATRRLVLLACGAAVAAGVAAPAVAAGGDRPDVLTGLRLPERAVSPAGRTAPAPAAPASRRPASDTHVVRPGESLWSIAQDHPGLRWPAIWTANRRVVGDDPDLIHPGQVLRLPGPTTPETDGDHP